MSWGNVAIAGATVIGASMQSKSASKSSKAASQASAEQLAFEREQYDDWQEIYGPLQENLADYYTNLTPEFYEAVGLQNYQQELQDTQSAISERIAQSGLSSRSGVEQSLLAQAEIQGAEDRAQIRSDAERQTQEDKTRFLQIGLGQNPSSSLSQTLAQRSSNLQSIANQQQQAAGQATGAAVESVGNALSAYFNNSNTGGKA